MKKETYLVWEKNIVYICYIDILNIYCICKLNIPCVFFSPLECCPPDQACDVAQKADVAAVVMQEGLANLVLVTPAMTLLRAKVEVTIPRKRRGSCTQHEKVSGRFPQPACKPATHRRPNGMSPPPRRLWRGSTRPWCRPSYVTSTLTVGPKTPANPLPSFNASTTLVPPQLCRSSHFVPLFGGFSMWPCFHDFDAFF